MSNPMPQITLEGDKFILSVHFLQSDIARAAPDRRFDKSRKVWILPVGSLNAMFIRDRLPMAAISPEAKSRIESAIESESMPQQIDDVPGVVFNGCRTHQKMAIEKVWKCRGAALFHRMRTGKTFTTIRLANGRHMCGQIDAMVVICPTSIKEVWANQFDQWSCSPASVHILKSGGQKSLEKWKTEISGLPVLVVGVEALSSGSAFGSVMEFINGRKVMSVCDESTKIKNHNKARTEKSWAIADASAYKVILTGSEITKGPEDLFAQYRFLGQGLVGHASYYSFRNRYCIMGGYEGKQIISYCNMDELMDRVRPFTDIVEMKDVVDLPPKMYQQRITQPSKEQVDLVKRLKVEFLAENQGKELTVANTLALSVRCQQIMGGFFPYRVEDGWESEPLGSNPKLSELMNLLEEETGKVIIWCRFIQEIRTVSESLMNEYGIDSVVQYHGKLTPTEREKSKYQFQNDPGVRFIVANQQTGAMGIELSAANLMVYYSNSYNYEDRIQSEERATAVSKKESVGIIDLVMDSPIDRMIIGNLSNKQGMAEFVKDNLKGFVHML